MKRFMNLGNFKSVKKFVSKTLATILIAGVVFSDSSIIALAEDGQSVSSNEAEPQIETEAEKTEHEEEQMQAVPVSGVRMMLGATPFQEEMTLSPSDGDTIDFSSVLEDGNNTTKKIVVNITANGEYTFTGENKRSDGEYADVEIIIDSLTEADINFNECHIRNDDGEPSGFMGVSGDIAPLKVNGIARIHVQKNSVIEALYGYIAGNGTVYFADSVGESKLTFQMARLVPDGGYTYIEKGYAVLHFQEANVVFTDRTGTGEAYGQVPMDIGIFGSFTHRKVYLEGNKAQFVNVRVTQTDIYSAVYPLPFNEADCVRMDLDGNLIDGYKISNYNGPEATVLQIGRTKFNDLRIPKIQDPMEVYSLAGAEYLYAKTEGSEDVHAYQRDEYDGFSISQHNEMPAYRVNFVETGNESEVLDFFYVYKGGNVIFPKEDDNYDYTYTSGGNSVGADTTVNEDMTVLVTTVAKPKISITIDGASKDIDYGAALSTVGADKYLVDISTGKLYRPTDVITEVVTLVTLSLQTKNEEGKEWFILNTAADMTAFAKIVNNGSGSVNGYLNADVNLPSDFVMIGCGDSKFTGEFNGNNHIVTLSINTNEYVGGLFAYISGGAKIKNVITQGSVTASFFAAGLVGNIETNASANVTIEKCINNANVLSASEDNTVLDGAGGIVAQIIGTSGKVVLIDNCGNTGSILTTTPDSENYSRRAGIVAYKNSTGSIIVRNCFNTDNSYLTRWSGVECKNSYSTKVYTGYGILKDAAAFESGEVTYLLNAGNETPVWHQTCGEGLPSTTGTAVVYAGYADCEATTLSYTNSVNLHTKQGHQDKGEYSYNNGKIVAKCSFCSNDMVAELKNTSERLGSQTGITVNKSAAWVKAEFPDVTIKYATKEADVFSESIPSEVGSWAIKAYVEGTELTINDIMYTVLDPEKNAPSEGASKDSYNTYVDRVIDQIISLGTNGVTENTGTVNKGTENKGTENKSAENKTKEQTEATVIKFNGGAVPASVMIALGKSQGVVIHFSTFYMGEKYDFMITPEIAKLAEEDVPWCGPLYIKSLFDKSNTAYNNGEVHYTVVKGDSLSRIAQRFGTNVNLILKRNPLLSMNKYIFPGQDIIIFPGF